jgi:hypothetical protein
MLPSIGKRRWVALVSINFFYRRCVHGFTLCNLERDSTGWNKDSNRRSQQSNVPKYTWAVPKSSRVPHIVDTSTTTSTTTTTTTTPNHLRLVHGIRDIVDDYDHFLLGK